MAFTPFLFPRHSDYGVGTLLSSHHYLPGLPLPPHGLTSPLLPKLQSAMGRSGLAPGDFLAQPPGMARPFGRGGLDANDPDVEDDPMVELEAKELWQRFHKLESEMVITKSGRSVVVGVFGIHSFFSRLTVFLSPMRLSVCTHV
ncbi:hypothetical protein C0Q70_08198 [Pomacea canaliculata]|uniref:T-box domain-containing protein n=1 Tax=Pomacea canaliculata TaxID=400727 RepID=A0A2T7PH58_POMCA|nr:hypothetical protein C0Q70_08198 [Pomacea canaliculata]